MPCWGRSWLRIRTHASQRSLLPGRRRRLSRKPWPPRKRPGSRPASEVETGHGRGQRAEGQRSWTGRWSPTLEPRPPGPAPPSALTSQHLPARPGLSLLGTHWLTLSPRPRKSRLSQPIGGRGGGGVWERGTPTWSRGCGVDLGHPGLWGSLVTVGMRVGCYSRAGGRRCVPGGLVPACGGGRMCVPWKVGARPV